MEFKGQIERYITKSVDNINRITVEFKAWHMGDMSGMWHIGNVVCVENDINRITVEFKASFVTSPTRQLKILIESQWNLKPFW